MRALFERDFFGMVVRERFFVIRGVVVGAPLLIAMVAGIDHLPEAPFKFGQTILAVSMHVFVVAMALFVTGTFAPILADERKEKKLEVLMSTPVALWTVIAGRFAAYGALCACMWLAFLPAPSVGLLFGGVAWTHVVAAALISLGSVMTAAVPAILVGASMRDTVRATRVAYLTNALIWLGTYFAPDLAATAGRGTLFETRVGSFVAYLNPNRALTAAWGTFEAIPFGDDPGLRIALAYLGTAGGLAFVALLVSGLILRATFEPRTSFLSRFRKSEAAATTAAKAMEALRVPKKGLLEGLLLGRFPALWLEIKHSDGVDRVGAFVRIVIVVVVLAAEALFWAAFQKAGQRTGFGVVFDPERWHIGAARVAYVLAFIQVTVVGVLSVRKSRARQALEVLHATPLTDFDLTLAHVLAALRAGRYFWFLGLGHLVVGCWRGELSMLPAALFVPISLILLGAQSALSILQGLRIPAVGPALFSAFLIPYAYMAVLAFVISSFVAGLSDDNDLAARLWVQLMPHQMPFALLDFDPSVLPIRALILALIFCTPAIAVAIARSIFKELLRYYFQHREDAPWQDRGFDPSWRIGKSREIRHDRLSRPRPVRARRR